MISKKIGITLHDILLQRPIFCGAATLDHNLAGIHQMAAGSNPISDCFGLAASLDRLAYRTPARRLMSPRRAEAELIAGSAEPFAIKTHISCGF